MKFSVVIPVYRAEEYLQQCIRSVTEQTYRQLEIILVDDGSPDRSGEICDECAQQDNRICVLHTENHGASHARNIGIRHATGDYILFLDSDDWWTTDRVLESIALQLERTPVDVLTFNYRKSYDSVLHPPYFDKNLPSSQTPETLTQIVQHDRWVSGGCNKAISRQLLTAHELYFREGVTSEDIDWALRVALKAETFAYSDTCVFVYRQLNTSASHRATPAKMRTLCDNVKLCARLVEEADEVRAEALKPFVAYQYGTLIYNLANLPGSEQECLMEELKQMQYLLDFSQNPKVRMIRWCSRYLGLPLTMALLRLRYQLQIYSSKGN